MSSYLRASQLLPYDVLVHVGVATMMLDLVVDSSPSSSSSLPSSFLVAEFRAVDAASKAAAAVADAPRSTTTTTKVVDSD